jgi:hypothetical protein
MLSLARMSGSFSSEIRAQLVLLRGNVSKSQQNMQSDIAGAIQKLGCCSSTKLAMEQNWKVAQSLDIVAKEQILEKNIFSSKDSSSRSSIVTSNDDAGFALPTSDREHPNVSAAASIPKQDKSFFGSLFSKVSSAKADSLQLSKISAEKTGEVAGSVGNASATAHLKTVFSRAKGAVEAKEALQSRLSEELHAQALAKIEKEWEAAAIAKTTTIERTVLEPNTATMTKTAAQIDFLTKESSVSISISSAGTSMEATTQVQTNDATGEQDESDISNFSDHRNSPLRNEDSSSETNATCDEKYVQDAQSIIAATLAMTKQRGAEILKVAESPVITPPHNASSIETKMNFHTEGRKKLQDRPASAESMRSSFSPSEHLKVSFLNDVVYEDAGDSSPSQGRVSSTVAERSGRKVLAGTSKLVSDIHPSTKVRVDDSDASQYLFILLCDFRRRFRRPPALQYRLKENRVQEARMMQHQ